MSKYIVKMKFAFEKEITTEADGKDKAESRVIDECASMGHWSFAGYPNITITKIKKLKNK